MNINNFEVKQTSAPCIPDSVYKELEKTRKNESAISGVENNAFPLFDWPLEGLPFVNYVIGNYVDDDGRTGFIKDYMGFPHSYDGHQGTDIGISTFRSMDKGYGVVAGAEGIITEAVYNEFDRDTITPGNHTGNRVIIRHDDGTWGRYWHLRKNSIAVKVGERVERGQFLGLVGSSGWSTGPHLHFETHNPNHTIRDPWNGTFNTLPSLWNNQEPYARDHEFWVLDAGLSTQQAVGGDLNNVPAFWWRERPSQPGVYGINEPFIMVWLTFQSKANDSYRIEIRRPNSTVFSSVTYNISQPVQGGGHYWYWNFSGSVTQFHYGTWSYVILSGGDVIKEIPFEVGPTTMFGPRFFPLAGRSFRLNGTTQRDTLRVSSLGGAVTYSISNPPQYVSLSNDSIVSIDASANPIQRSSFFQAVATDGNGRRDTMWYHIVNPNTAKLTLSKLNVSCHGIGDGSITAGFGSGAGYSIRLNEGAFVPATTPFVFSNLDTGLYLITLKDMYGSAVSDTISMTQPASLSLSLSKTDIDCNGSLNGTVQATFGGGAPGYWLKINNGPFFSASSPYTVSNLAAGTHRITLRDAQNCSFVDSIQITQPTAIPIELSAIGVTCYGSSDGSITVFFPDSLGHTIRLDGGNFDSLASPYTFSGLTGGIHTVSVRNSIGCERTDSVSVQEPEPISLAFEKTPTSTISSSDGSITVEFSGGIPGYSISFNGSAFEPAISPRTFLNLANGVYYTVTIRDTQNCEITDSARLNFIGIVEYQFAKRWNLVSLPLTMAEYHIDSLFPTATSLGFRFDRFGYQSETTLKNNVGYWMKFFGEVSLIHQGFKHEKDTMIVEEGWNIIGSHFEPVAVTDILSDVEGMTTSDFFGYNQGYVVADTILPGKAYWVKVNQPGAIILSSSIDNRLAKGKSLTGLTILPTDELPPAPPEVSSAYLKPEEYALSQNYPNPFNPSTIIRYHLSSDSWVTLKVYTILGEEVATLKNEFQNLGTQSVVWDAAGVASGMYYYRLQVGDFTETKKLLIVR